jgi:cell division protein FtsB
MMLIRKHRLELIVASGCLALLGYVAWQGVDGPRSFHYRDSLARQSAQLDADLAAVVAQRVAREEQVQRLRPETVDADLVDEIARRDLNMAASNDLVVLVRP